MKISMRYVPLTLAAVFFVVTNVAMQQPHICKDLLGFQSSRCFGLGTLFDNFGFHVFIFSALALLTGFFLTGIRTPLVRAWLIPALLYCALALFLIINIGPVKNQEQSYASVLGLIFYFGTISIMLLATAVVRTREKKPVIAWDGIAKLLLLAPITYFVLYITVFAYGHYFTNSLT